jgi:hypothetical protein
MAGSAQGSGGRRSGAGRHWLISGAVVCGQIATVAGIGLIWSGGLSASPASAARSAAALGVTHAGSERGVVAKSSSRTRPTVGNYDWVYKHLTFKNHLNQSGDFTITQAGEANCVGAVTEGTFNLPTGDLTKDVGAQINTNSPCGNEASSQRFEVHVGIKFGGSTTYAAFYIRLDQFTAGTPYHLQVAQRVTDIYMPPVGHLMISNNLNDSGVLAEFFVR